MTETASYENPSRPPSGFAALLHNVWLGVRAALLLRVPLERVAANWTMIAATLLLALVPWLIAQRIDVGAQGELSPQGLSGIWFPFALIVLAAACGARLLRRPTQTGELLVVLLNANIAIDVVVCTLPLLPLPDEIYLALVDSNFNGYWLGIAVALQLLRLRGWRDARGWPVALGALIAIAATIDSVWQSTVLWRDESVDTPAADTAPAVFDEAALYRQPALLHERLQRLQPGVPDQPDLYFLGVAGDAAQKVFLREIRSVHQIMLERFTRQDHSVLLVNNAETLPFEPIATATAIEAAARRFAEVMNRDDDVLFVYLTSHGSREDGFHLNLPPLRLKSLQPAELRRILDDAGIRWRIIVVSACYSGVFVEPLADDHTLVITAAAADRASFGCADENDYTYFGRAYFEDALADTNSFTEAFALARTVVTEREQAEGETPSLPQIAVGSAMAAKLDALSARAAPPR